MGDSSRFCPRCNKTMVETNFYKSYNIEKYPPDGRVTLCKSCLTAHVDNWNPDTYLGILEELDVPYVKHVWDNILKKNCQDIKKVTGTTVLGRYLSQMKMVQWNKYRWADTEKIIQEEEEKKRAALAQSGLSEEEIAEAMVQEEQIERPQLPTIDPADFIPEPEPDPLMDELTDEDKLYLRIKWGDGYRASEWVKMEQLYEDMMASYDIQTAGHKDTLILICKASLKANQCIDAGDIDGFGKMSRVYDNLMKAGKFTAAQIKGEDGEFVNCVGELVAVCEQEGFIPRYYTDGPQDKIDRVLEDYQGYVHKLITEEMGLGDMIENALREIERDKEREATVNTDEDEDAAIEAYLYTEDDTEVTEEDYEEFNELRYGRDDE